MTYKPPETPLRPRISGLARPGDGAAATVRFSDGSVRIEAANRAWREWLLRYCARPPFALDQLRERDPERLLYVVTKPGLGGNGPLLLTPLPLLNDLAALVPPPRIATLTSAY
jgi:hypothetical protein